MILRHLAQNTRLIANVLHYIPTQQYTEPQEECPAAQQCQRKNTTVSCATVSARTLPPSVQVLIQEHYCQLCNSISARTLLSAVQVSMQEHYCQLCNTESMQEHYFQLCNSQCKNTSISGAGVTTRTLLSAV